MKEVEMNIPALRFPGFEGEWELKKLGEVFTFRSTNSYSRENLNYNEGKVKNIHYGDIHTQFKTMFDITKERVPFINADIPIEKISKDNYCKEGDLIIADASEDYADIGKSIEIVNLNNEDVLAGLHTLQARPDLLPMQVGFSGYLMQSERVRLQIKTIAQGTKVLGISASRLNNIELYLPTLPEQNKIASFLCAVDEKLQQLKQEKAHLTQYKKGVMQQIFCRNHGFEGFKDDTDGDETPLKKSEKSFNPSNLRFRQDDGSAFPDWEEKSLGEVAELTSSKRVYSSDYVSVGIPFYRGKEISELKLNIAPTDILYISEKAYLAFKETYGVPKINDILMTAVGTLGNVLRIKNNDPFYFKDGNLIWFRDIKESSSFLEILFEINKEEINKISIGSTQRALTMVELRKLVFKFPSIPEQIKIANFLSAIDEKITNITNQITLTEQWKKGLLQGMFV